jgi:hypothetical protein
MVSVDTNNGTWITLLLTAIQLAQHFQGTQFAQIVKRSIHCGVLVFLARAASDELFGCVALEIEIQYVRAWPDFTDQVALGVKLLGYHRYFLVDEFRRDGGVSYLSR